MTFQEARMSRVGRHCSKYRMLFPDPKGMLRVLEVLSERSGLCATLLHGRVTRGDSWCDIEFRGDPAQVGRAIHHCEQCGARIQLMGIHECTT